MVERSMHSCGHSLLVTTRLDDLGHFKVESERCEACMQKELHARAAGEDKIGGRIDYVVDRRALEG